jgi:hypothetical protein
MVMELRRVVVTTTMSMSIPRGAIPMAKKKRTTRLSQREESEWRRTPRRFRARMATIMTKMPVTKVMAIMTKMEKSPMVRWRRRMRK